MGILRAARQAYDGAVIGYDMRAKIYDMRAIDMACGHTYREVRTVSDAPVRPYGKTGTVISRHRAPPEPRATTTDMSDLQGAE